MSEDYDDDNMFEEFGEGYEDGEEYEDDEMVEDESFMETAFDFIDDAASAAMDAGYDMCGNEGQTSIMESVEGAVEDAALAAAEGGDPYNILLSAASYPEAVGDILAEMAGIIEEVIAEGMQDTLLDFLL